MLVCSELSAFFLILCWHVSAGCCLPVARAFGVIWSRQRLTDPPHGRDGPAMPEMSSTPLLVRIPVTCHPTLLSHVSSVYLSFILLDCVIRFDLCCYCPLFAAAVQLNVIHHQGWPDAVSVKECTVSPNDLIECDAIIRGDALFRRTVRLSVAPSRLLVWGDFGAHLAVLSTPTPLRLTIGSSFRVAAWR